MKKCELIAKAAETGVEINLEHINNWLRLYATRQEVFNFIDNKQIPDDVDIHKVSNSIEMMERMLMGT